MGDNAEPVNEVKEVKEKPDNSGDVQAAETQMSQEATGTDAASIMKKASANGDEVASSVLPKTVLTGGVEETVQEKPKADSADGAAVEAKSVADEIVEAGKEVKDPGEQSTQKHLDLKSGEKDEASTVNDAIKEAGKEVVDPEGTSTKKHVDLETGTKPADAGDKETEKPDAKPADKELEAIKGNLLKIFDGKSSPQGLLEATRDLAKNSPDGNLRLKITDGNSSSVITLQNSEIPGNRGKSNTTYKQMTHMYVSKDGGRTRVALRGVERNDNGKFDQQRDKNGNFVEYGGTGLNTMKGIVQDVDNAKVEMTTKDGRKVEATFSKNAKGEVSVDVKEIKPEPKPEAVDKNHQLLKDIYENPQKYLPELTNKFDLDKPTAKDVVRRGQLVSAMSDLGVQSIKVTPKGADVPITLRPVKIKGENGNPDVVYLDIDGEKGFAGKLTPDGIIGMDSTKPLEVFDKNVYSKINGLDWSGAKVEFDYRDQKDYKYEVPDKNQGTMSSEQANQRIRAKIPQEAIKGASRTVNNAKAMENFMENAIPGYDFPEAENVKELNKILEKPEFGYMALDPKQGHKVQPGDLVYLEPNGKNPKTKDMDATIGIIRSDGQIVVPIGDGTKFETLGTPQQIEAQGFGGRFIRPNELTMKKDSSPQPRTDVEPEGGDKQPRTDVEPEGGDKQPRTDVEPEGGDKQPRTDVQPEGGDKQPRTDVQPEGGDKQPRTDVQPEGGDKQPRTDVQPDSGKGNFDHLSVQEAQQRLRTAFSKFLEANSAKGGDITGLNTANSAIAEISGTEPAEVESVKALEKELPGKGFERIDPKNARPGDLVVMQGKVPRIDQVGIINTDGKIQIGNRLETYENVIKGHDVRVYSPVKIENPQRASDKVQGNPQEVAQELPRDKAIIDAGAGIVDPEGTTTKKALDLKTGEGTDAQLEAAKQQEQALEKMRDQARQIINVLFDGGDNYEVKNDVLHGLYQRGIREFDITQDGKPPYKVKLEKFAKSDADSVDPVRMSIQIPGQESYEPYLHAGGPTEEQTGYGKAYRSFNREAIEGSNVEMRFADGTKFDFEMTKVEAPKPVTVDDRQDRPEVAAEISDVFKTPDKAKAAEHTRDAIRSLNGIISSGRFVGYGDLDAMAQSGINQVEFQNAKGETVAGYRLSHKDGKYTLHRFTQDNPEGIRVYEVGTDPAYNGQPSFTHENYATYQFRSFSGMKMKATFIDGSFHFEPIGDDPAREKAKM